MTTRRRCAGDDGSNEIVPGDSNHLIAGECAAHRYNRCRSRWAQAAEHAQRNGAMSGTLKIHIDQDKCQGHARCKSLAPELFNLDEYGNAHEIGDGTVPKGLEDKAWLAQANCPEIAIDVTEE
jgi:ferredoxin